MLNRYCYVVLAFTHFFYVSQGIHFSVEGKESEPPCFTMDAEFSFTITMSDGENKKTITLDSKEKKPITMDGSCGVATSVINIHYPVNITWSLILYINEGEETLKSQLQFTPSILFPNMTSYNEISVESDHVHIGALKEYLYQCHIKLSMEYRLIGLERGFNKVLTVDGTATKVHIHGYKLNDSQYRQCPEEKVTSGHPATPTTTADDNPSTEASTEKTHQTATATTQPVTTKTTENKDDSTTIATANPSPSAPPTSSSPTSSSSSTTTTIASVVTNTTIAGTSTNLIVSKRTATSTSTTTSPLPQSTAAKTSTSSSSMTTPTTPTTTTTPTTFTTTPSTTTTSSTNHAGTVTPEPTPSTNSTNNAVFSSSTTTSAASSSTLSSQQPLSTNVITSKSTTNKTLPQTTPHTTPLTTPLPSQPSTMTSTTITMTPTTTAMRSTTTSTTTPMTPSSTSTSTSRKPTISTLLPTVSKNTATTITSGRTYSLDKTSILPNPASASDNFYIVNERNASCIVLVGHMSVVFHHWSNDIIFRHSGLKKTTIKIPPNAAVSGHCTLPNGTQDIILQFHKTCTLQFTFRLNAGDLKLENNQIDLDYRIHKVALSCHTLINNDFPGLDSTHLNIIREITRSKTYGFLRKPQGFNFSSCTSTVGLDLNENTTLRMSNMKFKAFNTNNNIEFSGNEAKCSQDNSSGEMGDKEAIIFGCVGVILFVLAIIGACVYKRKSDTHFNFSRNTPYRHLDSFERSEVSLRNMLDSNHLIDNDW